MVEFTPIASLIGGAIVGFAAGLLFLFNGKISGISGIVATAARRRNPWRVAFLGGLIAGGLIIAAVAPTSIGLTIDRSYAALVVAGLLVGYGTQLGGGCTSGHGICGISRGARRSFAATLTFMAVAIVVVRIVRVVTDGAL